MKALLETVGAIQLVDPHGGQMVGAFRPHVVHFSGFYGQRQALGQIKILCGSLHDSATDAEFAKYVAESDGNMELAVDSFKAAFDTDIDGVAERIEADLAEKAEGLAAAAAQDGAEEPPPPPARAGKKGR